MRDRVRGLGRLVGGATRLGWRGLTGSGRVVLAVSLAAALAAGWLRWPELWVLAIIGGVCLAWGAIAVLVPAGVTARLELRTPGVTAGTPATVHVRAERQHALAVRAPLVALPLRSDLVADGTTTWSFVRMPTLQRGSPTTAQATLAPVERGVYQVGPAGVRRTDPLGLVRRTTAWTDAARLHVRPRLIDVGEMGASSVHDLDGTPSQQISMSDLAFHALREYVPGDDLRHVHWRSSARAGELHVRQYHDTRRTHVVIVVDDHLGSYERPIHFELALSIAGSLAVRLGQESRTMTFAAGAEVVSGPPETVLDATCRARLRDSDGFAQSVARAAQAAPGASLLVVVSGVASDPARIRAARDSFARDIHVLTFETGRSEAASTETDALRVRRLVDLPAVLAARAVGVGE